MIVDAMTASPAGTATRSTALVTGTAGLVAPTEQHTAATQRRCVFVQQRLDAAWATYQQNGRSVLLLDLHALADDDIQLHVVTAAMLPRLEIREHLVAAVKAALADYDPAQAFRVLVWLPASMCFFQRKRLDAGTA